MTRPAGSLVRFATPIKALAQRFAFFLLIGLTFVLMLAGRADIVAVERARMAVSDAVAPILDAASRPVATVANILREGQELATLRAQNSALRAENARLQHWQVVARQLEAENAALAQLLNMAPEPGTRYATGRVVADSGGPFMRSVLVNAGAEMGVSKGQAALDDEGLAGRVAEVGQSSARVLLITDINSRIPVVVESSRYRGILAGDNSERPKLVFLPKEASVEEGARIVTSGHGGVFPPGLPVGRVVRAGDETIRVAPFADWNRMEYLRVVDYGMPGILVTDGSARDRTAATLGALQ